MKSIESKLKNMKKKKLYMYIVNHILFYRGDIRI